MRRAAIATILTVALAGAAAAAAAAGAAGAALTAGPATAAGAPHPHHEAGAHHGAPAGGPTLSGQDAFAAIAEVVALLDADPATDWSRVDLERLRQHLADMHDVVLRAAVQASPVDGGLVMDVTGAGRVEQAIRAMVIPHARELDAMPDLTAAAEARPGGVRLTVRAADPQDARAVARIRGLGFAGLLTLGAHHQPHHLALARGEAVHGH